MTGHDFKLSWQVGGSKNVAVGEKKNYTRIENVIVDAENPKKFTNVILLHESNLFLTYL